MAPEEMNCEFKIFNEGDVFFDSSACEVIPSQYICWPREEEASDKDILDYAANCPAFAFLADEEEDIYSCDDGQPI